MKFATTNELINRWVEVGTVSEYTGDRITRLPSGTKSLSSGVTKLLIYGSGTLTAGSVVPVYFTTI
ncbi:hypothetical protein QO002_004512 [Pararhizobium capsulatum DSM 1112]|uniref:Uncharacterized protein n=1 Tax=Pararhizobium capsulatum DSM 1112 TaxID=1121113 RepID=A0ABU0BVN2_9HYPH|nr:hypothetical protein [Pararhizobium capsulatum DSM 1112]